MKIFLALFALATVSLFLLLSFQGGTSFSTKERIVALSFDDGPNPPYTQALLSVLKKHSARATFFTLGRNLQMHRRAARDLLVSGHELANHAFSHRPLPDLPEWEQKAEIEGTEGILKELGIRSAVFFRPPYGSLTFSTSRWLKASSRPVVLWSRPTDPIDYIRRDPRLMLRKVLSALQPGSILLFHDGEGIRAETVQLVDWVLSYLKQQGFRAVPIGEISTQLPDNV